MLRTREVFRKIKLLKHATGNFIEHIKTRSWLFQKRRFFWIVFLKLACTPPYSSNTYILAELSEQRSENHQLLQSIQTSPASLNKIGNNR